MYLATSYASILGFHIIWFLSCHWPRLNIIDDLPEKMSFCPDAIMLLKVFLFWSGVDLKYLLYL